MRGVVRELDHGSGGKILVMVKAVLLFHFDIDCIRIVHVDMDRQLERRLK